MERLVACDQVQSCHSLLNLPHLESRAAGPRSQRLKMRATPEKAWRSSCSAEAGCRSLEHVHLDSSCSCNIKNVALPQVYPKLNTDFSQIRCSRNYLTVYNVFISMIKLPESLIFIFFLLLATNF